MHSPKRLIWIVAVLLAAALAAPAAAQAATIYINSGVSGAKLGMTDTTAAKKLGKVKKKYVSKEYGYPITVRCFGAKSHGNYSLYLYSNSDHKVTAFLIYSSRYVTKKKIHVGSTTTSLKKAYGKALHKQADGYYLKSSTGRTTFETSKGKVSVISVWR